MRARSKKQGLAPIIRERFGRYAFVFRWILAAVLLLIAGGTVAAAFHAQSLFTFHLPALVGPVQIYLIAAAVFAFAFRLPQAASREVARKGEHLPIRATFVVAGVALWCASIRQANLFPQDTLPLLFWAGSVALFLAGVANWPADFSNPISRLELITWKQWAGGAVVVAIVLAALGIRLYRIGDLPHFIGEEAYTGIFSQRFVSLKDVPLYTLVAGTANVQYAFYGTLYSLFGETIGSLRLPNALFGTFEVLFVYLLGKELGGRRAGLVAAILLAALAVHVHFSRVSMSQVAASFSWIGTAAFLARGIRRKSWFEWALAGVIAGFGVNFFHPARLLPIIMVPFAVGLLILRPRPVRWLLPGFAFLAAGFMVGVGPIAGYFWTHPEQIMGRSNESWFPVAQAALTNPSSLEQPVNVGELVWTHLRTQTLGFNLYGDAHSWYRGGRPMLGPDLSPLFFLGVAAITIRLFNWRCLLLAIWLWSSFLILGVGSNQVPVFHRPIPLFALSTVTVGLALSGLSSMWKRVCPWRFGQLPFWLAAAVFVAVVGVQQLADYFPGYAPRENWPVWDTVIRYMYNLSPENDVVVVGNLDFATRSAAVQFGTYLGKKNAISDWKDADTPIKPAAPNHSLIFVFHPSRFKDLPTIKELYPGGTEEELRASGKTWWIVYSYTPAP